jgi:hypothetical protein
VEFVCNTFFYFFSVLSLAGGLIVVGADAVGTNVLDRPRLMELDKHWGLGDKQ